MSGRPTEVTPFARMLGVREMGVLDEAQRTYVVCITPTAEATNFFHTVHGGYLQGILDDIAGMLIFLLYGTNSAITVLSTTHFLRASRLNQPLKFNVQIAEEDECQISVTGSVCNSAGIQIVCYSSRWTRRTRRS